MSRVHKIALAEATASGGVSVSRSVTGTVRGRSGPLPANSIVVLSGARAPESAFLRAPRRLRPPAGKQIPIKNGAFTLDGSESKHGPYTMRIHFDKRAEPLDVQVFLSRSTDGGLLVLRGRLGAPRVAFRLDKRYRELVILGALGAGRAGLHRHRRTSRARRRPPLRCRASAGAAPGTARRRRVWPSWRWTSTACRRAARSSRREFSSARTSRS